MAVAVATAATPPGSVHTKTPLWIKRVRLPPDNDENQYLDVIDLPVELRPHVANLIPIDFANQAFQYDMMERLPSMQEAERDMGLLPFVVYVDPLTVMIRAKELFPPSVRRTEPLKDPAKIEACAERGTITMFDLHRLYVSAMSWFACLRTDELTRERINFAFRLHEGSLKLRAAVLQQATKQLPRVADVLLQMRDPNSTITSFYDEEIALQFEPLLRAYFCSCIRQMQLVIVQICVLSPHELAPHRLLLLDEQPHDWEMADAVVKCQQEHTTNFVQYCNVVASQERMTPHYDEAHIISHPAKRRGHVNPSLLFQTMMHILIQDLSRPLPEEVPEVAPIAVDIADVPVPMI